MTHWTERFFEGAYQQEYYDSTDDAERTAHEAEFIERELCLTAESSVLDLACGAGRHALVLAPQVATITAIDFTEAFLVTALGEAAKLGCKNIEFVQGDMRELDYEGRFDAAYNYFTAWGYYSDQENFDVLARVHHALNSGGRFMLEILNRDALMRKFIPRSFSESEDGTILLETRRFDSATGRAHNKRVHLRPDGARDEMEFDHYLPTADALIRHMLDAGFSQAYALDPRTGEELTIDSWRMAVIATK